MFANLLTLPYKLAVCSRLWLYQRGWMPSKRLPCSVVSVGNLTVGGTGKTPVTMWVAQYLAEQGKQVAILSRGYKRNSRESFLLVSDGNDVLAGPADAGDEASLMAANCPGIIVAVGADRYQLGLWVLEHHKVDCVVLDDGFQHLGLERDLNLLLIDVTDFTGLKGLLPFGRLREPLSGAKRATGVIYTRAGNADNLEPVRRMVVSAVGAFVPSIAIQFEAQALVSENGNSREKLSCLQGISVLIFCGIGNPSSFRGLVESLGAQVVDEIIFSDHMVYTAETIQHIQKRMDKAKVQICVTTEKDLVKVKQLQSNLGSVWALSLGIKFLEGQETFEKQLARV